MRNHTYQTSKSGKVVVKTVSMNYNQPTMDVSVRWDNAPRYAPCGPATLDIDIALSILDENWDTNKIRKLEQHIANFFDDEKEYLREYDE